MFFIGLSVGFFVALVSLVFLVGKYNNRHKNNEWSERLIEINKRNLGLSGERVGLMYRIAIALEKIERQRLDKTTEYILILENHIPVKLVDSMDKYREHDSKEKEKTWLSFELNKD